MDQMKAGLAGFIILVSKILLYGALSQRAGGGRLLEEGTESSSDARHSKEAADG